MQALTDLNELLIQTKVHYHGGLLSLLEAQAASELVPEADHNSIRLSLHGSASLKCRKDRLHTRGLHRHHRHDQT